MPEFPSIDHVAVTVTDLERSTRWCSELLAAAPVLDEDEQIGGFHHTVFALEGGQLFGLHIHPQAANDRFDEHRTGLDHISFACCDRGQLQTWAEARSAAADRGAHGIGCPGTALGSASSTSTRPRRSRCRSCRR